MENKEPKIEKYHYRRNDIGLLDEECPILKNGTRIGSYSCIKQCGNVSNFNDIEEWVKCKQLNKLKI